MPLAFAFHQVAEGFVWRDLDTGATRSSGSAVTLYLLFAWVLIPVLAPLAIMLVEPPGRSRRRIGVLVVMGAVAGAYLSTALVAGTVSAHAAEHIVQYGGGARYADLATVLYVVATCGAPLLSSHRGIVWFGIANLAAVAVVVTVQTQGLTSIWCSWAAVVSILIFFQFVSWRNSERRDVEVGRRLATTVDGEVRAADVLREG